MAPSALQFKAGGKLSDEHFYAQRAADTQLPLQLRMGEFCYVLAPRQMGKSSLCYRTLRRLELDGICCASIDLMAIGTRLTTAADWYFGLLFEIQRQLSILDLDVEAFWANCADNLSPVHRFLHFLRHEILSRISSPIVIFIDEIDAVRTLNFPSEDFFGVIRAVYNQRTDEKRFNRLTFCLLGVAQPSDLIQDERITPFNIGIAINLADFTRSELSMLAEGLAAYAEQPKELLDAIYDWTSGHPYMTQRICAAIAQLYEVQPILKGSEAEVIASLVDKLFLAQSTVRDANLAYAEKCLSRHDADPAMRTRIPFMLDLYADILRGVQVQADGRSEIQGALLLTGMISIRSEPGAQVLGIRNRIFDRVFDRSWLQIEQQDRLLAEALSRWLDSDRNASFLLRGAALRAAESWAEERRQDLTLTEQEFLRACLRVEAAEAQQHSFREQHARELADAKIRDIEQRRARENAEAENGYKRAEHIRHNAQATIRQFRHGILIGFSILIISLGIIYYIKRTKIEEFLIQADKLKWDIASYKREIKELDQQIKESRTELKQLGDEKQRLLDEYERQRLRTTLIEEKRQLCGALLSAKIPANRGPRTAAALKLCNAPP